MIKHAYMILAHKNPDQLQKLLGTLDRPENDIYLHIDRKAGFDYGQFSVKQATLESINPRIRVTWGGASIVRVEMALLEAAVKRPHSYYHLLSGLDLPLKSNEHISKFFSDNAGKEFLDLWKMPDHTRKRVEYFTPFPEGFHFFLTNWLNHAFKAIFPIRINKDVEFYQGSQWFSITEDFARFVVDHKDWVRKTFRHTGMCDEIFLPTLLMMSPFKDNVYLSELAEGHAITMANLRYIAWGGSGSIRHPRTFTINDYDTLTKVPHLWARKFDETIDSEIIDKLTTEQTES